MNLFFPNVAHAASKTVNEFIANVGSMIINPIILFLFALALVYFLYGVAQFIGNASNDEKKTIGKSHMIWGIVGLTIMMGVWTILNIILSTMNIPQGQINPKEGVIKLPRYNPPSSVR